MATSDQWAAARVKYEGSGLSAAKIAAEIGVSGAAMSKHASKNGWVKYSANAGVVKEPLTVKVNEVKPGTVNSPEVKAIRAEVMRNPLPSSVGVGKGGNQNGVMYSTEVADAILQRLKDGESLSQICKDEGMPSHSTVLDWKYRNVSDFGDRYVEARQIGTERLAEEIMIISDDPAPRLDNGATDSGAVQQKRLQVDTRKFLLAKVLPRMYGDNKHVEFSGNVTQTLDKATLQDELRQLMGKGLRVPLITDVTDVEPKDGLP